tara:strand:- start:21 stop:392 length:372 start_codon:yes stop_codon:yes gene_type:complete
MAGQKQSGPTYSALAKLIREARLARNLSQRKLSSILNMSDAYASHLESGRIQPTVQTLRNIASTLRLPYSRLALLAGYLDKDVYDTPNTQDYMKRLTDIGDLNDEEWKSVLDFARYIRSKRHE